MESYAKATRRIPCLHVRKIICCPIHGLKRFVALSRAAVTVGRSLRVLARKIPPPLLKGTLLSMQRLNSRCGRAARDDISAATNAPGATQPVQRIRKVAASGDVLIARCLGASVHPMECDRQLYCWLGRMHWYQRATRRRNMI